VEAASSMLLDDEDFLVFARFFSARLRRFLKSALATVLG
jgi:hypothetical protein